MCYGMFSLTGMTSDDVLYTPLPLYHSAGGVLGSGMILFGPIVVIRRKFSVTSFWADCIKYNCTVRCFRDRQWHLF